jgi:hypothetical protein
MDRCFLARTPGGRIFWPWQEAGAFFVVFHVKSSLYLIGHDYFACHSP